MRDDIINKLVNFQQQISDTEHQTRLLAKNYLTTDYLGLILKTAKKKNWSANKLINQLQIIIRSIKLTSPTPSPLEAEFIQQFGQYTLQGQTFTSLLYAFGGTGSPHSPEGGVINTSVDRQLLSNEDLYVWKCNGPGSDFIYQTNNPDQRRPTGDNTAIDTVKSSKTHEKYLLGTLLKFKHGAGVLNNVQDALLNLKATIPEEGDIKLTLTGHSRGAIQAILLANAIYNDDTLRNRVNISLVLSDPVTGGRIKDKAHDADFTLDPNTACRIIPPNVKNLMVTYQASEKRADFTPLRPNDFYITQATWSTFIKEPGWHNAAIFGSNLPEDILQSPSLGVVAKQILRITGTGFKSIDQHMLEQVHSDATTINQHYHQFLNLETDLNFEQYLAEHFPGTATILLANRIQYLLTGFDQALYNPSSRFVTQTGFKRDLSALDAKLDDFYDLFTENLLLALVGVEDLKTLTEKQLFKLLDNSYDLFTHEFFNEKTFDNYKHILAEQLAEYKADMHEKELQANHELKDACIKLCELIESGDLFNTPAHQAVLQLAQNVLKEDATEQYQQKLLENIIPLANQHFKTPKEKQLSALCQQMLYSQTPIKHSISHALQHFFWKIVLLGPLLINSAGKIATKAPSLAKPLALIPGIIGFALTIALSSLPMIGRKIKTAVQHHKRQKRLEAHKDHYRLFQPRDLSVEDPQDLTTKRTASCG